MSGPISDSGPVSVGKMKITDQERSKREALKRAVKPRIASTIVLTCGPKNNPKILMGQRSSRHDFMPSVYVFPGGRVDRADSYAPYAGDLSPRTETILEAAYNPRKARAVVLASIRETLEETGLMIGQEAEINRNINHITYDLFRQAGQLPDISDIEVFGRAITPPHRHKRYDTWFFIKDLDCKVPPPINDSHELLNVGWFTFEEIQELELQRATRMMLQVLKDYMTSSRVEPHVFYSRAMYGKYVQGRFP